MATTSVRYIVNDVDAAIEFYTQLLGFQVDMHPGPGFARITHRDLALLLNTPGGGGGAGQPMPGLALAFAVSLLVGAAGLLLTGRLRGRVADASVRVVPVPPG